MVPSWKLAASSNVLVPTVRERHSLVNRRRPRRQRLRRAAQPRPPAGHRAIFTYEKEMSR